MYRKVLLTYLLQTTNRACLSMNVAVKQDSSVTWLLQITGFKIEIGISLTVHYNNTEGSHECLLSHVVPVLDPAWLLYMIENLNLVK